jgi:D-serine deaminase-like pyridoxal phosphate-dependent protein
MGSPYAAIARTVRRPELHALATPALVVLAEVVSANIAHYLRLVGSVDRARPHIKTARTPWAIEQLLAAGITKVKAATHHEAALALEAGMSDVLLSYPALGPQLEAMGELAERHPDRVVSVLVDEPGVVDRWPSRRLGAFVDLDTGHGRTGVPVAATTAIDALVAALDRARIRLGGLHAYDGHLAGPNTATQIEAVRDAIAPAIRIVSESAAPEFVIGGSHTFLPGLAACDRAGLHDRVTASPGTVVYGDHRSLSRFGADTGFRAAAFVLSRVVSAHRQGSVTVDAGLTAIQVDAGRPHFVVAGQPGLEAGEAAQEHAGVLCPVGAEPAPGTVVGLVPFHIDTALSQFARVHIVHGPGVVSTTPVLPRH